MFNVLVTATDPTADAAWIIMEPEDSPPMSGPTLFALRPCYWKLASLPMQEPVTYLTLQAPGGLVGIRAECAQGKVTKVAVKNLPSFASQLDATLEFSSLGQPPG